jgi:hypothetical protein
MNKKSFKRIGELHDGINHCVWFYILQAKSASGYARKALTRTRAGHDRFDEYLRYRMERRHWICAAKMLLKHTTTGVVYQAQWAAKPLAGGPYAEEVA